MKISHNPHTNTYTLHDVSEFHLELIGTAINNENVRLAMLAKLSDKEFKEVLINDAVNMNAASKQEVVDIAALKEALNDPAQLKKLRSNSEFGKNSQQMQRLMNNFVEEQRRLLNKLNLDLSRPS